MVKKAAALANLELGLIDERLARAIVAAADEVIEGKHDDAFPAGRLADGLRHADEHELKRGDRQPGERTPWRHVGGETPIHPNDHVNLGQSSNDTLPTAMHIAAAVELAIDLNPGARPPRSGSQGQGRGVPGHRQDRPDASAGRDAADPRSGVLADTSRKSTHGMERDQAGTPRALRARARRHRRRHRPERACRVSPSGSPPRSPR